MVLGRTIYVFIKLLPSILALRKDRVLLISDDKKDYRKRHNLLNQEDEIALAKNGQDSRLE